jgi:hypothetical protein
VSIEADLALGVPYGNDLLQSPGVFGKWYLYVIPEGHFRILKLVWWYGAQEFAYLRESAVERCVGIGGHPFIIQEGRSMNVAISSVLTAAE